MEINTQILIGNDDKFLIVKQPLFATTEVSQV